MSSTGLGIPISIRRRFYFLPTRKESLQQVLMEKFNGASLQLDLTIWKQDRAAFAFAQNISMQ